MDSAMFYVYPLLFTLYSLLNKEEIYGVGEGTTEHAKDYGRLFIEMFEETGRDFYKMDLDIHSPAKVQMYNITTGNVFSAGRIRKDHLKKSFFHRS